jgi:hypothetical protein
MFGGDRLRRAALCVTLLALLSLRPEFARAEFPPDGAVADPNNQAIASGIYPMPTRDGPGLRYVFYFDCGIGMWIGVAVSGPDSSRAQLLKGQEFPSGPPPGAERDAADRNHASNKTTGEDFVFRGGDWRDAKTGASVKSPRLCATASHAPARPSINDVTDTDHLSEAKPLFPDAYRPPLGESAISAAQKPDNLPSQSVYIPVAKLGMHTLNPDQGPIRISIPRPDGRLDVLH